jgi:glycosyltransferase involved in cell wall biosynthesis
MSSIATKTGAAATPAAQASPATRTGLSACIIAMDEEDRIEDCLRSLAFCDEIVVVDSHSSDGTREIAAELGARVIERDWPGHVAQKEFAIRTAENDWVLCVDADERITPELRAEIAGFPGHAAWRCPRLSNYLGKWIRHGTWYPDLQLRLFDRRRAHWGGNDPHDKVELEDPDGATVGRLAGDLQHYPYRSFREHLRTIDGYTTIMARGMYDRGRKARLVDVVVRPAARFFKFYVLKRGFLLGWQGLMLAYLVAYYVRLKYVKLLVMQRLEGRWD